MTERRTGSRLDTDQTVPETQPESPPEPLPEDRSLPAYRRRLAARVVPVAVLALVVVLAAALRLDALTGRYGQVDRPGWARAMQVGSQELVRMLGSPLGAWDIEPEHPHQDGPPTRYISDPYTYLRRARSMESFYGAHYREPVFPFVVKGYVWLLDDQNIAVSVASGTFSVLCVLAAYLLGTMAFSRWVGLAAALGMAIERDLVWWGISGWRDSAFTFMVMVSVCAILFYRDRPSPGRALALGVCAALACLTRIFSVTFLAPGFLYLLLRAPGCWRRRIRDVAIATITTAVLVAPYLLNCWRDYGDPLYALNYQPLYYLAAEGAGPSIAVEGVRPPTAPGALDYIGEKLLKTPFQTLDTVAPGMTVYPFSNKWSGFDAWHQRLGGWLAGAALAGLVLFVASERGRLLLVVLACAQVPFAFTWRLSSDWRYTEFAYPFFLVAAGLVITRMGAMMWPSRWREVARFRPTKRSVVVGLVILGSIVLIAWFMLRGLPVMKVREVLLADREAVVVAGPRDESFFAEGWGERIQTANVTARVPLGDRAAIYLPLPRLSDYQATLRMDPFPPPAAEDGAPHAVSILFNGVWLRTVDLTWDPERVGSYSVLLRASLVKPWRNRLEFATPTTRSEGGARAERSFKLWYVLVKPVPERGK